MMQFTNQIHENRPYKAAEERRNHLPLHTHYPIFSTTLYQLNSRATNSQLARLLHLSLEHNPLLALLPHLRHERLAREHCAREAHLDVLEGAEGLVDGLAGNAEEAEAMQDGDLEAAHLGEGGVDVEGVGGVVDVRVSLVL
jgi:hypothetical protein